MDSLLDKMEIEMSVPFPHPQSRQWDNGSHHRGRRKHPPASHLRLKLKLNSHRGDRGTSPPSVILCTALHSHQSVEEKNNKANIFMAQQNKVFARLPTTVVPQKYFLHYDVVDLDSFRFEGTESIQLTVLEATSVIKCHAVELYVFDVTLRVEGTNEIFKCDSISYLNEDQAVEFGFRQQLPAGTKAKLCLSFRGTLNNNLCGFYRSEYESGGEKRMMAVTQFEACDARRAFVCWDEPAVKASYEISLVTDPELVAISNTPVLQTELRPRANAHLRNKTRKNSTMEKVWRFAETPIMSSYLVGMVVGEFDSVSAYTEEGVLVTVYTPQGASTRGRFALNTATKALSFFSKQFGIPYPLQKLDMLAIPDFDCGAMENWGIVTYRETYLLIDEELSSFTQKLSTAKTVCHELAHQWFGNLVTMEWWTSLWLNEGFARFMEFEAVNSIYPEWNIWENFVQGVTLNTAMTRDALKSSHPIEVPVHHPDEVDQIFDMIAYAKGSSFIRMLYDLIGREDFFKGIHNYLVKFKYANAYTEELWASLEEASGLKITSMAESWTRQTGFPLVTVSYKDGSVCLTQERFLADRSLRDECDLESIWDIPLTFVSSSDPARVHRVGIWHAHSTKNGFKWKTPVKADEAVCSKIPAPKSESDWLLLNPGQSGFYLVNYPEEGWRALQRPVRELTLGKLERVSLLHSVFSCAKAGIVSIATAFEFASAYWNEPEYVCWRELSFMMGFYCSLYSSESFSPALQVFVRNLFAGVMKRLTWEPTSGDEGAETGLFRTEVISMLAAAEDPEIIAEAKRRFHEYMHLKNTNALPADLRRVVFRLQARHGDESQVSMLRARYEQSDFVEERLDCLAAMGCTRSTQVKDEVIQWALEHVRGQDIHQVFDSVASDSEGATFAWNYIQSQWDKLTSQYDDRIMGRIVPTTVAHFKTEAAACEVTHFMQSRPHDSYNKSLEEKLERVRTKSKCYAWGRQELAQWLAQHVEEE